MSTTHEHKPLQDQDNKPAGEPQTSGSVSEQRANKRRLSPRARVLAGVTAGALLIGGGVSIAEAAGGHSGSRTAATGEANPGSVEKDQTKTILSESKQFIGDFLKQDAAGATTFMAPDAGFIALSGQYVLSGDRGTTEGDQKWTDTIYATSLLYDGSSVTLRAITNHDLMGEGKEMTTVTTTDGESGQTQPDVYFSVKGVDGQPYVFRTLWKWNSEVNGANKWQITDFDMMTEADAQDLIGHIPQPQQ